MNLEHANRLTLTRDLWLAFDRQRFDAVDEIAGSMEHDWRLDVSAPARLLNVRAQGDETMLITDGAEGRRLPSCRPARLRGTPR